MSLYYECPHCKTRMKVPNSVAGQEIRCFKCRERGHVPELVKREEQSLLEQGVQDLVPGFIRRIYNFLDRQLEVVAPPYHPPAMLYCLFVLLFLPLLVFSRSQNDFQRRLNDIIQQANTGSSLDKPVDVSFEVITSQYSDKRVPGAHLRRDTKAHWFYGAVAWLGILIFILIIFDRGSSTLLQLSTVGFFTATIGIAGLMFLQLLAFASYGAVGLVGWMYAIKLILELFALAYTLAFMPGTNFLASFIGFFVSVGLLEEFFKALPFIAQGKHMSKTNYQTVCVWGLASGMGFGIAEGIYYSSGFYNGLAPGTTYAVRFLSCVGFHATLTAAAALLFYRNDRLISDRSWVSWLVVVISSLAPSSLLHALYDTFLKHELAPAAMAVAVISFIWLIAQYEMAHAREMAKQEQDLQEAGSQGQARRHMQSSDSSQPEAH